MEVPWGKLLGTGKDGEGITISLSVRVFVWRGKERILPWDYKSSKMSFLKQKKVEPYCDAFDTQCVDSLHQVPSQIKKIPLLFSVSWFSLVLQLHLLLLVLVISLVFQFLQFLTPIS